MKAQIATKIIGHCKAFDQSAAWDGEKYVATSEPNILLDKFNAVHPQNMARIFARALANEENHFIHRVAFGNGGTIVDAAKNITFKPPRDGLNVGDDTWKARLYNETYSEIIDDNSVYIGQGVGSSPLDDPLSTPNGSGPGVTSQEDTTLGSTVSSVTIVVVLNPNEPGGQSINQTTETNTESNFTFDEIGLFTGGAPAADTAGFQSASVGDKTVNSDTGLAGNQQYQFRITRDGGTEQTITFTTPLVGTGDPRIDPTVPDSAITYADLIGILNATTGDLYAAGVYASISDGVPIQDGGIETFGKLRFTSYTFGNSSSVLIRDGVTSGLFANLIGYTAIDPNQSGMNSGVRNAPNLPLTERERMLTHLCFSPVNKARDRMLTIRYTLSIVVFRST